jgi:hypothetical protein
MALSKPRRVVRSGLILALTLGATGLAWAQVPRENNTSLDQKEFFRPELRITTTQVPVDEVLSQLPNRSTWQGLMQRLPVGPAGRGGVAAYIDPRSGVAVNILSAVPLLPGNGVGNTVTLAGIGRSLGSPMKELDPKTVGRLAQSYVVSQARLLGIDARQLGTAAATSINPDLWQVTIPQVVGGVPVRYARVAATISHGNVVLLGAETWADVHIATTPRLSAEQALETGFNYANGRGADDAIVRAPRLELVPFAPPEHQQGEAFAGPIGAGYGHHLVWTFVFQRGSEDDAQWEAMVDAQSGEMLAFEDVNLYATQQIKGAVYPLTDTGLCPDPTRCGTAQLMTPMPFANTGLAAPNNFTNSAGLFDFTSGTVTTTLSGKFIRINDNCGAIHETSTTGLLDLGGVNNQHDCTTAGTSAGDTPASRSAYYELNKLAEQARGWLPTNTWLQSQVTANVNINNTCNAFWNGTTVNFYRSGGGCRNTGEIAAVFDHEWGHGLDDNDAGGVLSNSSEAYADIAAIYRLQASCVGYGFFQTSNRGCGQTADGTGFNTNEAGTGAAYCATNCSGVRDTDFAKHTPATPATPLGFVCGQCTTGPGPCGRQVHCAAAPVRQAAWDLVARDLTAAPFNLDSQSAFIVGNRLFYQGSGNIGAWHSCTCGSTASGCGATNGYMQWLAADDDNGNLNDGTPHMTAIFAAYNRHGIACTTPAVKNSGCSGGPTAAPNLTVTPGSKQASLTWNSVAGATRYWVFRSEGEAGCNFGKTLISTVTTTSFVDTNVAGGRAYTYNVVAVGSSTSCFSRASNCTPVTPLP